MNHKRQGAKDRETVRERRARIVDRELEAALAEAEADVKAGRVSGPYRSARALVRAARRIGKRQARRV